MRGKGTVQEGQRTLLWGREKAVRQWQVFAGMRDNRPRRERSDPECPTLFISVG